jgi:hypothetical protein
MGSNANPRQITNGLLRCGSSRHEGDRRRPVDEFCKAKTPDGLSYSCKACRTKENSEQSHNRYKRWKQKDPIKAMITGCRGNARKKGLSCDLIPADIVIPSECPILGIPLFFSEKRTYNTPSIDRIDNSIGYTKSNIVVCSWRANTLKKDATCDELTKLAEFYNNVTNLED